MDALGWLILAAGGCIAGIVNAVAGGSSFLTFPLLLAAGLDPLTANITNFIALSPGNVMAMVAYRRELARVGRRLALPIVISASGGLIGSLLLLWSGEVRFARLVPWLILAATLLFALGTWLKGHLASIEGFDGASWRKLSWFLQFLLAVYGGYFGAGIGILMLAILAGLGLTNIHAMNGLKNFFGTCINGVAAALFLASGAVDWRAGLPLLVGAVAGGYAGARFGRFIGRDRARQAVIVVGVLVTLILLAQQI